jgi:hypothetical protein
MHTCMHAYTHTYIHKRVPVCKVLICSCLHVHTQRERESKSTLNTTKTQLCPACKLGSKRKIHSQLLQRKETPRWVAVRGKNEFEFVRECSYALHLWYVPRCSSNGSKCGAAALRGSGALSPLVTVGTTPEKKLSSAACTSHDALANCHSKGEQKGKLVVACVFKKQIIGVHADHGGYAVQQAGCACHLVPWDLQGQMQRMRTWMRLTWLKARSSSSMPEKNN